MYSNDLSKKLTPKPISKPVEYRLLAAGAKDPRQSPNPMFPTQLLKGQEVIYDPGDGKAGEAGKQKLLKYVVGRLPTGKDGAFEDEIGYIEFSAGTYGVLTVRPEQTGLYEFLERSNHNASNPFRDGRQAAVYERVDHVAKAVAANAADDTLDEAIAAFRALSDERVLEFAAAKGLSKPDTDFVIIKRAVRQYVTTNPQTFIDEIDSAETRLKSLIGQGLDNDVLTYLPTEGAYKWKEQGVILHQVPAGFDGKESLFKYLSEDGATQKAAVKELEKQVKKATGGR